MASIRKRLSGAVNRAAFDLHDLLYRASGGRVGRTIPGVGRALLLDHRGRRSGEPRRCPLLYLEDGDDLVVVASRGGSARHPAWWLNLREMPETTVRVGTERRRVRPRQASAEERRRLWPMVVEMYAGYQRYQARTEREIPLVILSPAD